MWVSQGSCSMHISGHEAIANLSAKLTDIQVQTNVGRSEQLVVHQICRSHSTCVRVAIGNLVITLLVCLGKNVSQLTP